MLKVFDQQKTIMTKGKQIDDVSATEVLKAKFDLIQIVLKY